MKTKNGFWDSSALVPLCVRQNTSQSFRRLWRESGRVTIWSGSTVEIRSALTRLNRESIIEAKGLAQAVNRLEIMRHQWREIVDGEKLRMLAEDLPDAYGLRAGFFSTGCRSGLVQ